MEKNRLQKKDIVSFNYEEILAEMENAGEKQFRGKQIYSWLHEKLADDFSQMTNLSKTFREKLDNLYDIFQKKIPQKNSCLNLRMVV